VVSFSIGDTAEFLYGDERNVDKTKKVLLESGDVLIFGGKSRNIFHGITAILPYTSPIRLLEETNLCTPGRLSLTFRQSILPVTLIFIISSQNLN
jgi:alkylated DNA repair dioxygenase AlkB